LLEIDDGIAGVKLSDDKWSLKEIIGHLIDSASNNHQRFVRLQFGDLLGFPAYNAEEWISIQKYNNMNWDILVALWYNYNCLLINFIENSPESMQENAWIKGEEAIPYEELVSQYYKHIELHIEHFNKRKAEIS
jgi:hypothetical protein